MLDTVAVPGYARPLDVSTGARYVYYYGRDTYTHTIHTLTYKHKHFQ